MSLNCNELNLVLAELDIEGAFIQEAVQPGYDTIAFRLIKQSTVSTLIICTKQNACRMNLTTQRIPKNEKPLRFHEFLRSKIQGMRINSCTQIGLDRIIKLDVSTWKERCFIYIRLWSGAANVVVTDENGTILDCMFRRPNKNEVTGGTFIIEQHEVTKQERTQALEKFTPRDFADCTGNTYNERVDNYYSEHASALSRETLLQQAEKWYNTKHSRMTNALQKLLQKKEQFANASQLKHTGDLILAYAQDAQGTTLTCIDYDTNQEVHIHLDAKKTAQENAAEYYSQYKKSVSGMEDLEHDIQLAQNEIASLDAAYNKMLSEKNVIKLEQLLRHDTTPKQKIEKPHAGLHYEINGWTILVGRTAAENDELLRHTVKGQDMWLHTRDYAGGYVFIKAQRNKTVPLEILLYAGNLAVYHSKARKNAQADLYYTQVKYLRRAKNGPKGLVLPTQEKNLFVKLDDKKLRELENACKQQANFL